MREKHVISKAFLRMKIGKRTIGEGNPAYIIFEVASTHANNWKIARQYVDQAKEAGADALKFQLFTADGLLNPISSILTPVYKFFKTAETPRLWFPKLKELCEVRGIDLLCTPFDKERATFLNKVGLPAVKIASGDLTYHQLLGHVASFKKPVILSTGMGTMAEVRASVKALKANGCRDLILLQCVSVYPTPFEAANIRAMQTLAQEFKTLVGYSDNGSSGYLVPLLSVAMGASVIEKHVTSQKARGALDDIFSLSVEEFAQMTREIRNLEKNYRGNFGTAVVDLRKKFGSDFAKALGDGIKRPAKDSIIRADGTLMREADERQWARRGIYPKTFIAKGTKISGEMIISLRPDVGVSAVEYGQILGARAVENLTAKHPIKLEGRKVRLFRKPDILTSFGKKDEKKFAKLLYKTALFD